jgi:hypothetical protein
MLTNQILTKIANALNTGVTNLIKISFCSCDINISDWLQIKIKNFIYYINILYLIFKTLNCGILINILLILQHINTKN